MKILMVSQFFYPENFRINDLAKRLVKRGHSVTVLTGQPNYPGGDIYEGYGGCKFSRQNWEGIQILRVPVIPRKSGAFYLSLNYLCFVLSAGLRALLLKRKSFDVIYAFGTSPITQAIPALLAKKKTGARVILNVQDLWPDNVIAITGVKNPVAIGLLDDLVDFIYNRADVILGTSRSFVRAIKGRKGLKEKRKVGFWPQYSVVKKSNEQRRDVLREGIFHVVFTGNVGFGQGLELLLDTARILKDELEGSLVFDIVGDGRAREALEKDVMKRRLEKMIVFHGSFPEEEIPGILAAADAALLILKRDPIFERTIPAKLQTYLSCGCPVLACVEGESRELILENKVGFCCASMDAGSLADTTRNLYYTFSGELRLMGERAGRLSGQLFDPDTLIDKLEEYMEMLTRMSGRHNK